MQMNRKEADDEEKLNYTNITVHEEIEKIKITRTSMKQNQSR